jgi:hypothetical protein
LVLVVLWLWLIQKIQGAQLRPGLSGTPARCFAALDSPYKKKKPEPFFGTQELEGRY